MKENYVDKCSKKSIRMRLHIVLPCLAFAMVMSACGSSPGNTEKRKVSGVSQKGPFIEGANVTMQELNEALDETGKSFTGEILNDKGEFSINSVPLDSQYAFLAVNGFYRNEVSGKNSKSGITLKALVDISDRNNVNINLLTHLENSRVRYLVTNEHKSFGDAKMQARREVLDAFSFSGNFGASEDLNIFGTSDDAAMLLAVSIIVQGKASDQWESELTARLSRISQDIADGTVDDKDVWREMALWAMEQDLEKIRQNIAGWGESVPDFEKYVRAFGASQLGLQSCNHVGEVKAYGDFKFICRDDGWHITKCDFDNHWKDVNGVCVCDADSHLVENNGFCICDAANHWMGDSESCVCDADNHWVESNGSCVCDAANHWMLNGGKCVEVAAYTNCRDGWITVASEAELNSCTILQNEADIDVVAELPKLVEGSYCASGRFQGRYCRYVPPEKPDSRVNIMEGQRCTKEQSQPGADTLRIHIIDVANGDAIWIQTPTGQNVLIDGGDSGAYATTAGGPIVTDYLDFHGFPKGSEFDAVFLTHPHSDHFGGLPTIFSSYKLKNYIDPMDADTTEDVSSAYTHWIHKVSQMVESGHLYMPAEDKLPDDAPMPEAFFGPEVTAEYLFSRKTFAAANDDPSNPDTASIVFRLSYKGISMLFTGDATDVDEAAVITRDKTRLAANFLKVGNHGSDTSSTPAFLDAVFDGIPAGDRRAFISSGRKMFSGTYFPAESTLKTLVEGKYVTLDQLYSTSAGDDDKVESEASRDDNILIVIKPDGSYYTCYSGTN